MPLTTVIPVVAGLATVVALPAIAALDLSRWRGAWTVPAAALLPFLALSVAAVVAEGPFGFWTEHVRTLWGNQVWVDLLLAASIGFAALVPHARALRMRPVRWCVLVLCTGSIGLLAMAARILFLRDRQAR